MTQRIFNIENEKDYADLWDILPEEVKTIEKWNDCYLSGKEPTLFYCDIIKINWHDKTEITRPIPEVTEQDIGKLCKFWNGEKSYIGILASVTNMFNKIYYEMESPAYEEPVFLHCHRLTKQEIEELCR